MLVNMHYHQRCLQNGLLPPRCRATVSKLLFSQRTTEDYFQGGILEGQKICVSLCLSGLMEKLVFSRAKIPFVLPKKANAAGEQDIFAD